MEKCSLLLSLLLSFLFSSLTPFCPYFVTSLFPPFLLFYALVYFITHLLMILHWHSDSSDICTSSLLTLAGCDVWKVTSVVIQIPLDLSPWVQIFSWLLLWCCCRYTARACSVWLKPAVARVISDRWVRKINYSKHHNREEKVSWQVYISLESWVPLTSQREVKSQAVLHVPGQSWTDQATNVARVWAQPRVGQQERSWREKTAFIFLWIWNFLFLRISLW